MTIFKLGSLLLGAMLLILGFSVTAAWSIFFLKENFGPLGALLGFIVVIIFMCFAAATVVVKTFKKWDAL